MVLKLPCLEYRTARGNMSETFKLIHVFYDPEAVCFLVKLNESAGTRGHPFKISNQYSVYCRFLLFNFIFCFFFFFFSFFFSLQTALFTNNWNILPSNTGLFTISSKTKFVQTPSTFPVLLFHFQINNVNGTPDGCKNI